MNRAVNKLSNIVSIVTLIAFLGGGWLLAEEVLTRLTDLFAQQEKNRGEERFGDQIWVELDTAQNKAITDGIAGLRALIESDGSLLYRLGLRDGQALACQGH